MPLVSKKSLRRDRILHAAGRLFAYQGYHGTSTRQIAHLANIGENALFRHFVDKESLFWSTLSAHFGALDFQSGLLEKMVNGEPPELVLPKIVELFANTASDRPELLRLAVVAFLEMRPKGEAFLRERLSPAFTAISRYLETNIREGKIRDLEPTTAAVALAMTTLTRGEISQLMDKGKPLTNRPERNRAETRFWLDLLVPPAAQGQSVAPISEGDPS